VKETFRELYKSVFIFWDGFWVVWLAEILFVVCSLPIVTAPAAFAGMYFTMTELANGESVDWTTFFTGLKKYYAAGYRWFAINLLAVSVLVFYTLFALNPDGPFDPSTGALLSGIPLALMAVWALINFFTFPLMLAQEKPSYRQAIRNSVVIYLKWPVFTLIFGLLMAAILALSLWLIFPFFILGASLPALLSCICIKIKTETSPQ
jgi:hypothetical protein